MASLTQVIWRATLTVGILPRCWTASAGTGAAGWRWRSDEPAPHGPHDRLDGRVDADGLARRAGLASHGALGDVETARDRLDRLPLGHQAQHDELVVAEGPRTPVHRQRRTGWST